MTDESNYLDRQTGTGPDGSNLLGFLSATGALVTCANIFQDQRVTLHWEQSLGWRGCILIDGKAISNNHIEGIHKYLTDEKNRTRFALQKASSDEHYKTITSVKPADATKHFRQSIEKGKSGRSLYSNTYSGWFSDLPDGEDQKKASSSQLCALTGSGNQNFLKTARDLSGFYEDENKEQRSTTLEHLQNTLLKVWLFEDPRPSCRWDAQENRYHALRYRDPAKKHKGDDSSKYNGKIRTQRGANRLAIEALALFPLMPKAHRAKTPGFYYVAQEKAHYFTWPIWTDALSLDALKTLVAYPELTQQKPNMKSLHPLGVVELFRCKRIVRGRQVSFSVSKPVGQTAG